MVKPAPQLACLVVLRRFVEHCLGLVEPRAFLGGGGGRALVATSGEDQRK